MKCCPFCAEEIQDAAILCRFCQRDLPAPAQELTLGGVVVQEGSPPASRSEPAPSQARATVHPLVAIIIIAAAVAFFAMPLWQSEAPSTSAFSSTQGSARPTSTGITYANYQRLREGMSYAEVAAILGAPGKEISRSDIAGLSTVMYQWEGSGLGNMNATFQDGKLVMKAQFGLK